MIHAGVHNVIIRFVAHVVLHEVQECNACESPALFQRRGWLWFQTIFTALLLVCVRITVKLRMVMVIVLIHELEGYNQLAW